MCALKSWLESNPQMKCPSLSFLASVSAPGSAPWAWLVGESINQKVWRGPVCLSRSNLPPAPLAFWSWSVCDLCLLVWFWSLVCFGRWSEGGRERRSGYSSGFLSVWSPRAGPHPPRAPVRFLSPLPGSRHTAAPSGFREELPPHTSRARVPRQGKPKDAALFRSVSFNAIHSFVNTPFIEVSFS